MKDEILRNFMPIGLPNSIGAKKVSPKYWRDGILWVFKPIGTYFFVFVGRPTCIIKYFDVNRWLQHTSVAMQSSIRSAVM